MGGTSIIDIDLGAITHNMRVLRGMVGSRSGVCAVVKADAYGLGAERIAPALVHPSAGGGADMLAVYTIEQAAALFRAAVTVPILVMMPVSEIGRADDVYRGLVCSRLHLSVHSAEQLADLVQLTEQFAVTVPVHVEVDTGMSRGGCLVEEIPALLATITSTARLRLSGVYTHFAASDADGERTAAQNERFERLLHDIRPHLPSTCLVHAANTCAAIRSRRYHHGMIRVGQAWAGYGPECLENAEPIDGATGLRPAIRWSSRILHVKRVEAGATVGYGATWTAQRDSVIGLVPVGYADGYPLALSSDDAARAVLTAHVETPAGTVPFDVPVIGRVSMDQMTVDLTGLAAGGADLSAAARPGTVVDLICPDREAPNHLVSLARAAGTNPYEMLCRLHPRVPRRYTHASATIEVEAATAAKATARVRAGDARATVARVG